MFTTFVKLKMFLPSAKSVQSLPRRRIPLVTRRSTFLNHGSVEVFTGSDSVHSRPHRLVSVRPSSAGTRSVYGRPLANRKVTKAPKSRRMLPTIVPFFQSLGNWSDIDPVMLCVRLSSVGRIACGGGAVCPVRLLISRPSKVV